MSVIQWWLTYFYNAASEYLILSLIPFSEPTRLLSTSHPAFCLTKKNLACPLLTDNTTYDLLVIL
ncbi:hypothetical protein KHP24_17990, partial [Cronobacter sakazakii]|nr:hypothetical protein [Cronobacter sakazakii]